MLIRGIRADLNTFLAQIDILSMEMELELYSESVKRLDWHEEWRKMMLNLEKLMESEKIDRQMIGKMKNEYEQSEVNIEYRKNLKEIVGKMEKELRKIRKEIAENREGIYLTEGPFEEAENRLNILKNDQKWMIGMSDLRGILDQLIVEVRLEMMRNEFDKKFEIVNKVFK